MLLSFFLLALAPAFVRSLASTDSIQDADPSQSGYLSNHNMHPAIVGSSAFGFLWKNTYGAKEKWFASPLVYTPSGKRELVFLASSANIIRTVDALNGTLLNSRLVQPPFLQSDIGCTDIPDQIGIIGTPIIDPATDTVYFFSKGYKNGASSGGVANGIYMFYGVNINTLQDVPGFPLLIDGHNADSDPTRYFIGGTALQRPGLAMVNGYVIGAFGSHCDLFNYTGMIIAISTTPGVGVAGLYTMESSPGAPAVVSDITIQSGGKAGIWQGGMGISTDGSRIFIATGNGQGHANGQTPASGRTPLSTLDETVANFGVNSAGKFSLTDYFEPFEYVSMDAGDRDLGSGGVMLLDPKVFSGTGVSAIAVTVGKNGKAYIMNANNLGGFAQGPGGSDKIIQTIVAQGSVFGGPGSYPLEGGYIYFTPVGYPTVCYQLGFDSSGTPQFTLVGKTSTTSAGRVGVGIPTITSYNGQAGTAILWIADPDQGLLAFNAVPVNGVLTPITIPPTGGLTKFIRPAFGDGRVYVSGNGNVMCLGSPVSLPLQCTTPVDFGSVAIGSTSTMTINCTANIAIKSINGCTTADSSFQCKNSTLPLGPLAAGSSFSFPVTWNLTQLPMVNNSQSSFQRVIPGPKASSLIIYTTNSVSGYSNQLPVGVKGLIVSDSAFLEVTPKEVDFGGLVISGGPPPTAPGDVIVSNIGNQTLVFLGFSWTNGSTTGNVTIGSDGSASIDTAFSSSGFPAVGSTIGPGVSLTIPLLFTANSVSSVSDVLYFWSTGGSDYTLLAGSGSTAPIANISHSTIEGGWDYSSPVVMNFGNVLAGTTAKMILRLCNSGGSPLEVTKSKPPIEQELTAANPSTDLHEGQFISINSCATAEIDIIAAPNGINRPAHTVSGKWILNTNDLTFGLHDIEISSNIVTPQVGPLLPNGTAQYQYLGCYYDGSVRQLQQSYNNNTNENGWCQAKCLAGGYAFAGTEYHVECWCGNSPPSPSQFTNESLKYCSYNCPGDPTGIQACGGNGGYISIYYDTTRYTPGSASAATSTTSGPVAVQTLGPYSFAGCYTEATNGRALTGLAYYNDSLTIEMCASVCSAFTWFGTEYTRECYCGNTINAGSVPTSSGCTMLCGGNGNEYCGGPSRLDMYTLTPSNSTANGSLTTPAPSIPTTGPVVVQTVGPYSFVGCYTEATNGRALTGLAYYNDSLTIEMCAAVCSSFTWFGTEYTRECYCGNTINAGSVPASSGCTMLCGGNGNEYCGGPSRLDMYMLTPSNSSSTAAGITVSSTSTSATPTGPVAVQTVGSYSFVGCYTEATNGRALTGLAYYNDSLTIEICASVCSAFTWFGTEYTRECYCGNTINAGSVPASSGCTMLCGGNGNEYCGGPNRLDMYVLTPSNSSSTTSNVASPTSASSTTAGGLIVSSATPTSATPSNVTSPTSAAGLVVSSTTSTSATPTGPVAVQTVGSYSFVGCYTEATNGRALTGLAYYNDSLTIEMCAAVCSAFTWFGTEYSRECYCGNTINAGSVPTLSGCTMLCGGNQDEYCGGPNRLNMYNLSSVPVASTTSYSTSTSTTVTSQVSVQTAQPYSFVGCYTEATNMRALSGLAYYNDSLTIEMCAAVCSSFTWFGTEYTRECYCGNTINAGSVPASSGCTMLCGGNPSEYCGGPNRLDLYMLTPISSSSLSSTSSMFSSTSSTSQTSRLSSTVSPPTTPVSDSAPTSSSSSFSSTSSSSTDSSVSPAASSSNSSSLTDSSLSPAASSSSSSPTVSSDSPATSTSSYSSTDSSALPAASTTSSSSSTDSSVSPAASSTSSSSTTSSSTESPASPAASTSSYSSTKSSSTDSSASPAASTSSYSTDLSASPAAQSTSSSLLTDSSAPPAASTSSYSSTDSSVSPAAPSTSSSSTTSSSTGLSASPAASSTSSSSSSSATFSSTDSSSSSMTSSSTVSPSSSISPTSLPSSIDSPASSSTGSSVSPSADSASATSTDLSSSVSLTSTSSPSPTSLTSTDTLTPSVVPNVGNYLYAGCYTEATGMRALSDKAYSNNSLTVEMCASVCAGFTWFGVENASDCYCGDNLNTGSVLSTSGCNMSCGGNELEYCGGPNMLNMYNSSTATETMGWVHEGCFSDPPDGPDAGHNMNLLFANDDMSIEGCISSALDYLNASPATTYLYVGLEQGRECYAATEPPSPEPTQLVGNDACTLPCAGNKYEKCGATNMYDLWAKGTATGTLTSIWSTPVATSTI